MMENNRIIFLVYQSVSNLDKKLRSMHVLELTNLLEFINEVIDAPTKKDAKPIVNCLKLQAT